MDDRMKESISALLDNEADELELRRVLNHPDDSGMRAVWSRYSMVSDLMSPGQNAYLGQRSYQSPNPDSGEDEDLPLHSPKGFLDIDISSQVSCLIDQIEGRDKVEKEVEQAIFAPPLGNNKNRFGLISTAAVAATIIMAVSLVFKPPGDVDVSNEVLVAYNDTVDVKQVMADSDIEIISSDRQRLNGSVANASGIDSVPMVKRPFSPEHVSKLNQYLLRHAENSVTGGRSGLMPLARVASFTIAKN